MKNIITLLILSTIIISCSKDNSETSTDNSETSTGTPENPKVYAYNNSSNKIVELDLNDGSEIGIIAELMLVNSRLSNIVFSINTNEIIGTIEVWKDGDVPELFFFVRINVANGEIIKNKIDYKSYVDFTMSNEGKLFTSRFRSTDRKILELDPNNGSEIRIIADLDLLSEYDIIRLVYSETTNELIGIQHLYQPPTYYHWLTRVSVSNGTFTRTTIERSYNSIIMSDNGDLYTYSVNTGNIKEFDPISGSEVRIVANLGPSGFQHIVYSETTNELIGIQKIYGNNIPNSYYLTKVNVENGQVTQVTTLQDDIYDFILLNQ